jgi:arylsulfatase A
MATQNNADPSHDNPTNFVRNDEPVGKLEGYSAPLIVEEAAAWLKQHRDKSKPFLLSVWTHEPHYPIKLSPEFRREKGS